MSTSDIDRLRRFNAEGDCGVLQVDYSILNRFPQREIFPYCQEHGIGVVVRGPLGMGLLAGKFAADDTFPEGDFRRAWIEDPSQRSQFLADLAIVENLKAVVPAGESLARTPFCPVAPGRVHGDSGCPQPKTG